MSTIFKVHGPFEVPTYQGKACRAITEEEAKKFWDKHSELRQNKGCYVFGIRAGKGFTPGYVGKATKSFLQETFTYHKLTRYQQFLADYMKGTPILFFVVAPKKKGAVNSAHISLLEDYLIQTALNANPGLLNIKGTKAEEWGILGLIRSGKGKPSAAVKTLKRMLKIKL